MPGVQAADVPPGVHGVPQELIGAHGLRYEDLVRAVREHTDNLSDYVEKLLASAVVEERRKKAEDERHWKEVCASWNEFHEKNGNFADEHNGHLLPEGYVP